MMASCVVRRSGYRVRIPGAGPAPARRGAAGIHVSGFRRGIKADRRAVNGAGGVARPLPVDAARAIPPL
jgi:hypothetical protein